MKIINKALVIDWGTPEKALEGMRAIMHCFRKANPQHRPKASQVTETSYRFDLFMSNQRRKIVAHMIEPGIIIDDIIERVESRPNTGGRGYAVTLPTEYDPAHFLAAVAHVEKNIENYPGSLYEYEGDLMGLGSLRYKNFLHHGLKCVTCGIEGKFFLKQKSHSYEQEFHMNLYAVAEDGGRILMTRDHIIPKSKGGPNVLENLQTMCSPCNGRKADKLPEGYVPKIEEN